MLQVNEIDIEIEILVIEIEILEIEILENKILDPIEETVYFCYKPIKCDICLKVFAARSTLQLHVEIFHDQIKRNSIKSDVLNEVDDEDLLQSLENEYISKANIKNEKFHETFFYSCDICQKQFSINKSLKTHIRSNATEKSLKCEKCDNSFSIESNLNMHREFQCGESSKDYSF